MELIIIVVGIVALVLSWVFFSFSLKIHSIISLFVCFCCMFFLLYLNALPMKVLYDSGENGTIINSNIITVKNIEIVLNDTMSIRTKIIGPYKLSIKQKKIYEISIPKKYTVLEEQKDKK